MNNIDRTKFFDVRRFGPKKGQVLASFIAPAEFINGNEKRDIIRLLKESRAEQATQIMRKAHGVIEPDCYRVCREMAEDLLSMSEADVENKVYKMVVNYMFYTEKENVPTNDPRWKLLEFMQYNEETNTFVSKINL